MMFSLTTQAYLYLIPNILAVFATIFVLYHLLSNRTLRQAINNHAIILILIVDLVSDFTDTSWIIHYNFTGTVLIKTPGFVLVWVFIDYSSYTLQTMLFAWATIERHILVFHDKWLITKRRRLFLHYLPIIVIIFYGIFYYRLLFFVPFCQNQYDYNALFGLSSVHCIFHKNSIIPKWNLIFNQIIPTLITIIFSLALLIRVLLQKRRLHRSINWRKQRKMIIQLLSISIIFLIFNAPYTLIYLAYNLGLPRSKGAEFSSYAVFFAYYIAFVLPFVCCVSLTDLRIKLRKLFCLRNQQSRIHPTS